MARYVGLSEENLKAVIAKQKGEGAKPAAKSAKPAAKTAKGAKPAADSGAAEVKEDKPDE